MCANWRQTAWQMDTSEVDAIFEKLKLISNSSERVLNNVLKQEGAQMVMDEIQPGIPLSLKQKRHAKKSKALNVKHGNLEFTIRPKRMFEYIKYPDLAIGTSHKRQPKMFMKKGLDKATPKLVDALTQAVINEIESTLN